jgi:Arc/MetJ-type ribon-helix-helix transcriptional regulator
MTIQLPEHVESSLRAAVVSGHFSSIDAAMTEAANLLLQKLKRESAAVGSPALNEAPDAEHRLIWDEILELTADVPDEEWDKLPTDLAEQHDHYIYGTPKRPAH